VDLVEIIAKNVRNRRLMLGISQEKLAEIVECQTRYLQDIEAGNRPNLTLRTIQRFAKALGVEPFLLLVKGGTVEPTQKRAARTDRTSSVSARSAKKPEAT
jgi:transcriptional regulator with XRE-family HTH domain